VARGLPADSAPWLAAAFGAGLGWLLGRPLNALLGAFFRRFNAAFVWTTGRYTRAVRHVLAGRVTLLRLICAGLGAAAAIKWLTPLLAVQLHIMFAYAPLLAGAAGAAAGWLLSWPLHWWALPASARVIDRWGVPGAGLYQRATGLAFRASVITLALYGGLLLLTYREFKRTPRGFIPSQDMGYLMISVQLPDSASAERTHAVMAKAGEIARSIPGVRHATGIGGQSFVLSAAGSNFGSMFLNLDEYADRRDPGRSAEAIAQQMRLRCAKEIYDGDVAVFAPPPVRGVGRAGGFALMVEDRGDNGPRALQVETDNLIRKGMMQGQQRMAQGLPPGILAMFTTFRANVPQVHIDPSPRECMAKGVNMKDFADTLQVFEGSLYVNDFNRFGRTWQVIVQAESPFRDSIEDLPRLTVRNNRGYLVPVGSLANIREVNGPLVLGRYNMYPAAAINGIAAPGMSSGEVMEQVQRLAEAELPGDMKYEWTDISFLEQKAGSTGTVIFACAVVMVFLVLAAQYESWSLPLAVILVVPMCLLCAIVGVNVAHMDINIFTQVGFVVLVGLASKNAILIVEFAKKQREAGATRVEAALAACRLRLRPIVMTSFAFILGVVPLLLSHGAGAEMRRTLGNAVFSGMLGVTLFGIFLTPVFFITIDWLGGARVFAAGAVRQAGAWALAALSLRPLRQAVRPLLRPSANGHRQGPGGSEVHGPRPVGREQASLTSSSDS
jgi:multidrug efflux pump